MHITDRSFPHANLPYAALPYAVSFSVKVVSPPKFQFGTQTKTVALKQRMRV